MIGLPLLVLGLLLVSSAFAGARQVGRGRGPAAAFLSSPIEPTTWRAVGSILAGFVVEVVAFTVATSLFSAGISLLVVGIGVVAIGIGIEVSRLAARIERRRVADPGGRPLLAHPYRPYGSTFRELATALFLDPARWRDVVYTFVAFPLTILEFVAIVVLWSLALGLLAVPLWWGGSELGVLPGRIQATLPGLGYVAFAAGIVLLPVAASVSQGLLRLHRAVVAGLLCESEQKALQRRVETLEGSRQAVLEVEASELRRIERDLHDGAQQRLVMLSIDLGLAAERIEADPAGARALVNEAQAQARLALAEIRDLVRGIAPAILMDRGLVAAVAALAARSPIATAVSGALPGDGRLPDAIERAAYFVVAESLANVAKHASATRSEVRVARDGANLVVEIRDDGGGGARLVPGGGLAGLAGRVEALDGSLSVDSPAGGPTAVRATIPVAAWAPPIEPPATEAAPAPAG